MLTVMAAPPWSKKVIEIKSEAGQCVAYNSRKNCRVHEAICGRVQHRIWPEAMKMLAGRHSA